MMHYKSGTRISKGKAKIMGANQLLAAYFLNAALEENSET